MMDDKIETDFPSLERLDALLAILVKHGVCDYESPLLRMHLGPSVSSSARAPRAAAPDDQALPKPSPRDVLLWASAPGGRKEG